MAISRTTMAIGFSPPPDFMSVPTFLPTLFLGLAGSTCREKERKKRRNKINCNQYGLPSSFFETSKLYNFRSKPHRWSLIYLNRSGSANSPDVPLNFRSDISSWFFSLHSSAQCPHTFHQHLYLDNENKKKTCNYKTIVNEFITTVDTASALGSDILHFSLNCLQDDDTSNLMAVGTRVLMHYFTTWVQVVLRTRWADRWVYNCN